MFSCIYKCLDRNYTKDSLDLSDSTWTKGQIESCQSACTTKVNGVTEYTIDKYECEEQCMKSDASYMIDVGQGTQIISQTCKSICNEYPEKMEKTRVVEKKKKEYVLSSLSQIYMS